MSKRRFKIGLGILGMLIGIGGYLIASHLFLLAAIAVVSAVFLVVTFLVEPGPRDGRPSARG